MNSNGSILSHLCSINVSSAPIESPRAGQVFRQALLLLNRLRTRKIHSINEMTAPPKTRLKSLATLLLLVSAAIIGVGLLYLFLTPKLYQASARLKVIDWIRAKNLQNPSNQEITPAECELIRSNSVLDAAIQNLGLRDNWGKRYHQGVTLSADEARELLKTKLLVRPLGDSSLIEICVASEIRDDTARIANEIARVYLDIRHIQHEALVREKLAALEKEADTQNQKIRDAQSDLDRVYFEIAKSRASGQVQVYDPDAYNSPLSNRVTLESQYVAQEAQFSVLKKMDPDKLGQVLSSLDTNSLVSPVLTQLHEAQNDLISARLDHGPDSKEVKDATLVVDHLKQKIDQLLAPQ